MIAAEPIELPFGYSTEPVVVRVCTRCREPRSIEEFRMDQGRRRTVCKPCAAEQERRRYEEDPEKGRERSRRYREEHPEEERERERYRRKENAARTPAQIEADRRELHPDGTKVCRSCREALPFEAFVADRMTRSGLSKDCRACKAAKQRARLERHVAVLFGEDRSAWECYVCGGPYEEIEHLWPLSLFGEDRPSNILPACVSCNRGTGGKHDRDPRAWLLDRLGPDDAWAILAERLPSSLLVSA